LLAGDPAEVVAHRQLLVPSPRAISLSPWVMVLS